MDEFGLDLSTAENHLERATSGASIDQQVVLGILDGTSDPNEWLETVMSGDILILSVDGDLNELAKEFARPIVERGGELTHFRGFLIVTPPKVTIDTDRL